MELNSRQLLLLAAPLTVTYLTWSTVQRGADLVRAVAATQTATTAKRVTPTGDGKVRDPFTPVGAGAGLLGAILEDGAKAKTSEKEESPKPMLTLHGTVITGRWRFAIINGERVVEGQRYLGLKVERIEADRVTLVASDGTPLELGLEVAKAEPPPAKVESAPVGLPAVSGVMPPDVLELLGIPKG